MNVLIIGGGFLSSNLQRHLRIASPLERIELVKISEIFNLSEYHSTSALSNILSQASVRLRSVFSDLKPDLIFCPAADTSHFGSFRRHLLLNLYLPKIICQTSPKSSLKIFFSSDAVYYFDYYRRLPRHIFKFLISDYSSSKYIMERYLKRRLRLGFEDFYCFRTSALVKCNSTLSNAQKNILKLRLMKSIFVVPRNSAMAVQDIDEFCAFVISRINKDKSERGFYSSPSAFFEIRKLIYHTIGANSVTILELPRYCFFILFFLMNIVTKLSQSKYCGLGILNYNLSFRRIR